MIKLDINFRNTIEYYAKRFHENFKILPILGCELEFYTKAPTSIEDLQDLILDKTIKISNEEGENQYELQFLHTNNIYSLLENIVKIKRCLRKIATFKARPHSDQPTSAMHIHLNFLDQNAKNIFDRQNGKNPAILAHAVGGLLSSMNGLCIFFAPAQNDYKRYTIESMNTPSNISWGINNRTTAIRITPRESGFRRIEHRVASADANPEKVLAAIFAGVYVGIQNKIMPMEPIYGNAFDQQYTLEKLPKSLKEAQSLFLQSGFSSILTNLEKA